MLKTTIIFICPSLTKLFYTVFDLGEFPEFSTLGSFLNHGERLFYLGFSIEAKLMTQNNYRGNFAYAMYIINYLYTEY